MKRFKLILSIVALLISISYVSNAQVTTVAGQSDCDGYKMEVCRFGATGMVYDPVANGYYVGDKTGLSLRFTDSAGIVHTMPSKLNGVLGVGDVTVDSSGIVYLTDNFGCSIWTVQGGGWTRIAGTGTCGYSGDGGSAAGAQLNSPTGIAVNANGSVVYVSDTGNQKIRKLTRSGVDYLISTVAGNWSGLVPPDVGDGRPAISAKLANPRGLAMDSIGRLWIADSSNHRIRRIGTDGSIITVVGTGTLGLSGDGGLPTSAKVSGPADLVLASDSIAYFTDTGNHLIRKVVDGVNISTVAGSFMGLYDSVIPTSAMFQRPQSLTIQPDGNLLIGDTENLRLRRVIVSQQITPTAIQTAVPTSPVATRTSSPTSSPTITLTSTPKPTICTTPGPTACFQTGQLDRSLSDSEWPEQQHFGQMRQAQAGG